MRLDAKFKTEFLMPGGVTLAAILLLLTSIFGGFDPRSLVDGRILTTGDSTLTWIALALAVVAVSYVLGILVVMVTFQAVASPIIDHVRADRAAELGEYVTFDRSELLIHILRNERLPEPSHLTPNPRRAAATTTQRWWMPTKEQAVRRWALVFRLPTGASLLSTGSETDGDVDLTKQAPQLDDTAGRHPSIGFVLSVGRIEGPTGVIDEYEYRRSNRQLIAGVMPAVFLSIPALAVHGFKTAPLNGIVVLVLSALLGLLTLNALLAAVEYQEKVAQGVLMDTAFYKAVCTERSPTPMETLPARGLGVASTTTEAVDRHA